jgi:hypothetical protein
VVAQREPCECGEEELEAVCGFAEQGDVTRSALAVVVKMATPLNQPQTCR